MESGIQSSTFANSLIQTQFSQLIIFNENSFDFICQLKKCEIEKNYHFRNILPKSKTKLFPRKLMICNKIIKIKHPFKCHNFDLGIRNDQIVQFKTKDLLLYCNQDMQSQTFKVVHLQTLQYKENTYKQNLRKQEIWNDGSYKLLTYQETCQPTDYPYFSNGFFSAFLQAYNNHGDIKITPDDVWIVIALYFSKYVNDHSEQLRKAFVSHEGKKKLVVTTHNQLSETQWDEFFTLMIDQIKKNTTEGVTAKLQCDFSTTNSVQRIFSTSVIMNTYKKYFDYGRCIPLCGIQNVHFGGKLQDWKKIGQKLKSLSQFDVNGQLNRYIENVSKILAKFVDTFEGKVDLDFWNRIVNRESSRMGSGSTSWYSGWLINFFGYYEKTQEVKIEALDFEIEIDNKITGIVKMVQLVGGFAAVSAEGRIFRPHLSMAIRERIKGTTNFQMGMYEE